MKDFFKKIYEKIINNFLVSYEPEIDVKELTKKTKKELEILGRKIGIELDRRLTKDKLIKQIKRKIK